MKRFDLLIGILLLSTGLMAQDTLRLEDAIAIALEQNYSIVVAANDAEIANNNAHPGAAGLYPTVSADAGLSYSNNNTKQEFAGDIPSNEVNGAVSKTYNASVGANYTLFDGLGNVYSLKQLNALAGLEEVQSRLLIENTLLQVVRAYLNVASLSENVRVLEETIEVSNDRYERTKGKYEFGAAKIDLLNAEVDLNTDSVSLMNAITNLQNAKRDLNLLLGREAETAFEVSLNLEFANDLVLQELRDRALTNNAALILANQNLLVSEYQLKMSKSTLSPIIAGNASYGYSKSTSEAGIVLSNQNIGFTGGLTLQWNIFSGKQRMVNIQNAKISIESSQQRYDEALNQVDRDVLNAFTTYQNSLYTLKMDRKNLETAQLNFERSNDLYKLGQLTNTQFREAQLNLLVAEQRITASIFNAKLAEIELYRLSGLLLNSGEE